jgi:hypothetical protein
MRELPQGWRAACAALRARARRTGLQRAAEGDARAARLHLHGADGARGQLCGDDRFETGGARRVVI